jgi:hypothetical protein
MEFDSSDSYLSSLKFKSDVFTITNTTTSKHFHQTFDLELDDPFLTIDIKYLG